MPFILSLILILKFGSRIPTRNPHDMFHGSTSMWNHVLDRVLDAWSADRDDRACADVGGIDDDPPRGREVDDEERRLKRGVRRSYTLRDANEAHGRRHTRDNTSNTIRFDTIRCDAMRCDTIRYATMRCDAMRCDAMRYYTIRYDTIRYDTTPHNTTRHHTTQHDTMQHKVLQFSDNVSNCYTFNVYNEM